MVIRGVVLAAVALIDIVVGFVALRKNARRKFGAVSTRRFLVLWAVVVAITVGVPALMWS